MILLLAACSKEDKAKKLIKESLSKTMNDYKSYEPVEYGRLDSNFTFYKGWDYSNINGLDYQEINKRFAQDSIAKSKFVPQFNGFVMTHSFRGKNALGALILNTYRFEFNKAIDSITSAVNVEEEAKERKRLLDDIEQNEVTVDTTMYQ